MTMKLSDRLWHGITIRIEHSELYKLLHAAMSSNVPWTKGNSFRPWKFIFVDDFVT